MYIYTHRSINIRPTGLETDQGFKVPTSIAAKLQMKRICCSMVFVYHVGEIVSSLKFWPQKLILFRSRAVSVCATATFHVPVFVDSSGVSLFTLGVHS